MAEMNYDIIIIAEDISLIHNVHPIYTIGVLTNRQQNGNFTCKKKVQWYVI